MNHNSMRQMLVLLSQREFDEAGADARVAEVLEAPDNPDLDWIEDGAVAMAYTVFDIVGDRAATSDTIDELHEQFEEIVEGLPPFPYDDDAVQGNSYAYFRWLDTAMAGLASDRGGYAVVSFEFGLDDHMNMVVVQRPDLGTILALAEELTLPITHENGENPYGH